MARKKPPEDDGKLVLLPGPPPQARGIGDIYARPPKSVLPDSEGLTEKERIFCQEVARHGDAIKATIRARLDDPCYSMEIGADKLLSRRDIKAEIANLTGKNGLRSTPEVTRESIVADMQWVFEESMHSDERNTAVAAKKLQSQLRGYLVEKREVTYHRGVDGMTDDQLMEVAGRDLEEGPDGIYAEKKRSDKYSEDA